MARLDQGLGNRGTDIRALLYHRRHACANGPLRGRMNNSLIMA
jgi:hypothetical protein